MTVKKLYKIAFMGDKDHGCNIISTLESWGGSNYCSRTGRDPEYVYFINDLGVIDMIHNSKMLSKVVENFYFMFWHDYNIECHLKVGESINYDGKDYDVDSIFFDANNRRIVYKLKSFGIGVEYITNDDLKPAEECKMEKQLAIKGHPTRGKEVIELLEMMGGKNKYHYKCIELRVGFTIGSDGSICRVTYNLYDEFRVFTLEEFLEKFPFKVGDKVFLYDNITEGCVTGMKWDEDKGTVKYCVYTSAEYWCDVKELLKWNKVPTNKETDDIKPGNSKCERTHEDVIFDSIIWHLRNSINNGKQNLSGGECEDYFREVVKKNNENKMKIVLSELLDHIKNTSKEELEKEFNELEEWSHVGPTIEEFMDFCNKVNKKPKYPKTYKECCDVLLIPPYYNLRYHTYERGYNEYATSNTLLSLEDKLNTLGKLIICRNAYWKIAGEEMGLDKPWEPNWSTHDETKFCISTTQNIISLDIFGVDNRILAFPTEEMRDAFYGNFKDLIEQCKESVAKYANESS